MPCTKQTTKKYTSRKSPPYPANECKNKVLNCSLFSYYIVLYNKKFKLKMNFIFT